MTGTAGAAQARLSRERWDAAGPWRHALVALGLVLAVIVFSYAETIASAYQVWVNSETHKFSLLVIPMSLFVIWERRNSLRDLVPAPSPPVVLLAIPFGGLWLLGETMHLSLATQVAVLGLVQTSLLGLLGWSVYRALLFPFLFLWLLVPAGDSLTPMLIDLTTHLTAAGVALFGLEVSTDGNIVISEAGRIGIVAECSALDFLIGNLVLSLFYANIVYPKTVKRLVYVAAGLLIALLANNVRTTSVILITHWTDREWDLLSDHLLFGWLVFFGFVVVQMAVGALFKDPGGGLEPGAAPRTAVPRSRAPGRLLIATALLVILVMIPPQTAALRQALTTPPDGTELDAPSWLDRHTAQFIDWRPVFNGTQATLFASHPIEDRPVDLFVGYYWRQDEDAEMIGWPNAVHDNEVWHFLDRQPFVATYQGEDIKVIETRLRGPDRSRRLAWHWYWVDGRFVENPLIAKLLQAKATLLGGDIRSAVIVLSGVIERDRATTRRALQALLDRSPFLVPMLDGAGERRVD